MPSRFHPGKPLPKGLDRDKVLRLLATSEGDRPADVRDRAILMVLVAYGLRSGEVAGLRLDDLDWTEEILRVRCPKPGRTHLYPLSRGVGQTILRYVRDAPLALAAFQHVGFVGLEDAGKLSRIPASGGKEPVPPAEGRVDGKPATHGGRAHRVPVRETGSERQPSLLAVKARQRRACRCIERLSATLALISAQAARLAARHGAGSAAMRAPAVLAHARLDRGQRSRRLRASGEHCPGFLALRGAELVNLREPGLKLLVIHHL